MYRYVRLRRKMLGVEELHMYDVYTPLVSGEHAIGSGKLDYLAKSVGPTQMKLMEDIKRVFDPKMILNPGKVCYKL